MSDQTPSFFVALAAGASAGISVDVSLFPIDTVKTRLQSSAGFWKAGGFRGVYSGILPVIIGSAPSAAVFFSTYEATKTVAGRYAPGQPAAFTHMFAACAGEVMACLIRVPVEVIKQRAQASREASTSILRGVLRTDGVRGLYRGYLATVMREIPFSLIQFPLWELSKKTWSARQGRPVDAWQSAVCGSVSGAISAALTTPLDVVKTRIMLASKDANAAKGNLGSVARDIWHQGGVRALFAGIVPRVMWISIGGFVFLGMYEKSKITLMQLSSRSS